MIDPRMTKLADVIVSHSTALRRGEKILIEAVDVPAEMVVELVRAVSQKGAIPFVTLKQNLVLRELYSSASETSMKLAGLWEAARMREMDAYAGLRGSSNVNELSDVPNEKMRLYQTHWWKPVHLDLRVKATKWVVLRWPHPSMAQAAGMSSERFEDFYFDVCTLDYSALSKAMDALVKRMSAADEVHITGPGTDLRFSIRNIPVIACAGERNLPDGEVFTAPVRDSVNGVIAYTAKTIYQGIVHENIRLEFRDGKIINASSSNTEALNRVLDTDEGARSIGEFALGLNPHITRPMLDILFDEKICGSFHFTPGGAIEEADNGVRSKVHWDMVCLQTPEYGGGEICFDRERIRVDGLFVTEDLKPLNPENLLKE